MSGRVGRPVPRSCLWLKEEEAAIDGEDTVGREDDCEICHQLARWVFESSSEQETHSLSPFVISNMSRSRTSRSRHHPRSVDYHRPLRKTLAVQDLGTVLCVRPYSASCPSFPVKPGQIRETRNLHGTLYYRRRRVCATASVLTRIAQLQPWVREAALARSLALAVPPKDTRIASDADSENRTRMLRNRQSQSQGVAAGMDLNASDREAIEQ